MIPKINFGRTGHKSSRTIFGAVALAEVNQKTADKTLELLFEYGVNHIDVARSYGNAELRIGPWMKYHRDDFFLATKTDKRTYKGAMEDLKSSMTRLRVEQLDLWQMHALFDPEEWKTAMGPGGALEAFIEAKAEGLVRFLGVTGHGYTVPQMHLRSLEKHDFDSVLLPYNYFMMNNSEYSNDFEILAEKCDKNNVAVQTIKTITKGPWNGNTKTHSTWYSPLTDPAEIEAAVHYSLSRPGIFVNTVGDVNLLPLVLEAADRFTTSIDKEEVIKKLMYTEFTSLF